jgi:hypothetical protein
MQIYEDPSNANAPNAGYVGIGNFGFTIGGTSQINSPQHLLHLHNSLQSELPIATYAQWTNYITEADIDDGLLIGIDNEVANINQQETQPLHFLTSQLPRMQIYDNPGLSYYANAGYVGIGDYTVFDPQSLLHQHQQDNKSNYHQFTNSLTGTTNNDGFKIGLRFFPSGTGFDYYAEIRQEEAKPIIIA